MLWQCGKSYSQDLRDRVFAAADDDERVGQIARLLRVSVSYVSKVLSRRRRTGQTKALPQRGHMPPKLAALSAKANSIFRVSASFCSMLSRSVIKLSDASLPKLFAMHLGAEALLFGAITADTHFTPPSTFVFR
jgi:hypothetical protein